MCGRQEEGRDGYGVRSHGEPGDEEQLDALQAERPLWRCADEAAPLHREGHPAREGQ